MKPFGGKNSLFVQFTVQSTVQNYVQSLQSEFKLGLSLTLGLSNPRVKLKRSLNSLVSKFKLGEFKHSEFKLGLSLTLGLSNPRVKLKRSLNSLVARGVKDRILIPFASLQESGRAGRDGQIAHCILYYRLPDVFKLSSMVFDQQTGLANLYNIVSYCLDQTRCRRAIIASYFDEAWSDTECRGMCDHCRGGRRDAKRVDVGE
jgi:Superfamily II DNA helicase